MSSTALPVVGIDLGGTKIAAGLVDGAGRVVAERRKPSNPAGGGDGVVDEMQRMVEELRATGPIAAIGVRVQASSRSARTSGNARSRRSSGAANPSSGTGRVTSAPTH
jgi:predicted NBD/HSP70 family sugar kinase